MLQLLLIFALVCFCLHRLVRALTSRRPPGPWGLPGLGILPRLLWRSATQPEHRLFLMMSEMHRKYGSVVSFNMGTQEFLLLSDYDVIKEALVTNADKFSERPNGTFYHHFTQNFHGIVGSSGLRWQTHRRFALRVLRDFGFGKVVSELRIQEECEHLVALLRRMDGQEVDFRTIIPKAVANIISVMLFSKRNELDDPNMDELLEQFSNLVNADVSSFMCLMYPEIPLNSFTERLLVSSKQLEAMTWILENCRQKVEAIRAVFDTREEPQNYIEAFLAEQSSGKEDSSSSMFTDSQLLMCMRDLYIAGTDTTSNTLCWALLYAALNAEWQDRCHAEIVAKIGTRQVTLKDRKELPMCLAFLDEVQRLSTLVALSVEHRTAQDAEFRGHVLSSRAIIFINLYGVHHDPKLFPNPNEFDPSRFLDSSGRYTPSEFLIPFSIGRRSCLGESLAKTELFLFLVSLLQHFRVEATAETLKDKRQILLGTEGIIHSAKPHRLRLSCRAQ